MFRLSLQELTLYPAKTGSVADLLSEAREALQLGASVRLRLLEIVLHKIVQVVRDNERVDNISTTQNKSYRVEVVPQSQQRVQGRKEGRIDEIINVTVAAVCF